MIFQTLRLGQCFKELKKFQKIILWQWHRLCKHDFSTLLQELLHEATNAVIMSIEHIQHFSFQGETLKEYKYQCLPSMRMTLPWLRLCLLYLLLHCFLLACANFKTSLHWFYNIHGSIHFDLSSWYVFIYLFIIKSGKCNWSC